MTNSQQCPCGSDKTYEQCCGPYLSGEKTPPTAEALMRSRYTAYTQQNDEYLLESWHPDTRPSEKPSDDDKTIWTRLHILRTESGLEGDKSGIVEFIAHCKVKGTDAHLHEVSEFLHDGNRWYYVDGQSQQPTRRESPKVGRNDPCPCGSGKKYKKCCGG